MHVPVRGGQPATTVTRNRRVAFLYIPARISRPSDPALPAQSLKGRFRTRDMCESIEHQDRLHALDTPDLRPAHGPSE